MRNQPGNQQRNRERNQQHKRPGMTSKAVLLPASAVAAAADMRIRMVPHRNRR
jgi:hypothetical protein